VAGQSKGKGYGGLLLNECVQDAKKSGMKGVAAVASEGNWLVGRHFLLKHGFESVDQYPSFTLTVKKFGAFPSPSLVRDFEERLTRCGKDFTIMRSDQCPYVDAAVKAALDACEELGIRGRVVELRSSEDVRRLSLSPYGVFGMVYHGQLVSYHSLAKKELINSLRSDFETA
jgi:hypothetical protein